MSAPTPEPVAGDASAETARRSTAWSVAVLAARLIVGGLLIYVSIGKLRDPVAFLKVVKLYELLPVHWNVLLNSIAVIVPWVELLGGIILILGLKLYVSASVLRLSEHTRAVTPGIGLRGTALVILLLLVGFTAAIGLRTWRMVQTEGKRFMEVEFECGCGTGVDIIWIKLLENGGLILLSLLIVLSRSYSSGRLFPPPASQLRQPPPDAG